MHQPLKATKTLCKYQLIFEKCDDSPGATVQINGYLQLSKSYVIEKWLLNNDFFTFCTSYEEAYLGLEILYWNPILTVAEVYFFCGL